MKGMFERSARNALSLIYGKFMHSISMSERKMAIDSAKLKAILGAVVLASSVGVSTAQSDVAECGLGPSTERGIDTHGGLYVLDGEVRTEADLTPALQQALFDARLEHYKTQREIIDAAILDAELARRARLKGQSQQDVEGELFAIEGPDDATIAAFYHENKARIPYPLDAVHDQIRQMLVQQAMQVRRAEIVAQAKSENSFQLLLRKPVSPYAEIDTDGAPSKGPVVAKVTIVEFADYQCPHCKRAAAALERIAAQYDGEVRIVYMDFPINPSGISRSVAEGGACADRQGRFWDYHDLAFEKQGALNEESATELAKELGLDADAFRACLDSSFPKVRVAKAEAEARRLGVKATPTLFLNGHRLHLHDIEGELPGEIDRILAARTNS